MIVTHWFLSLLAMILGSGHAIDGCVGRVFDRSFVLDEEEPLFFGWADDDDGLAFTPSTPDYQAAYQKAADDAEVALKEGRARLFSYGMLGMSSIDPKTGLAAVSLSGCVVSEEIFGRTKGNNDRVRAWIKQHGTPANSLLPWKDELIDVDVFFAARSKAGTTIPLRIGGPPLTSPDGRFNLRQVAAQVEKGVKPNRRTITTLGLEVSERGVVREVLTDYWNDGLTDLAWGPPGAPFAVVKARGRDKPDFYVLHLRPVDWASSGSLWWDQYLKEHPEDALVGPIID